MRIACFQGPELPGTPQTNLALLARMAESARSSGAELLIMPEMFLTGYAIGVAEVARLAEPLDGATLSVIAGIARDNGMAIVLGLPELSEGRVYNSAAAFDGDGKLLACYRKTHLFGEVDRGQFAKSDRLPAVFEIGDFKIGLLICYDVEFPENVRHLALLGAELVVVPTALMKPYEVVPNTIVRARAYENQIFIAYVNRCGVEADFDYCGLSCVIGPDGGELARAGHGQELILADLDRVVMQRSRELNTYLQDRRPDQYWQLTAGDPKP